MTFRVRIDPIALRHIDEFEDGKIAQIGAREARLATGFR
jgi:hypothetical protein